LHHQLYIPSLICFHIHAVRLDWPDTPGNIPQQHVTLLWKKT